MTTHGLVLGKFLPYHAGHAHLIREARRQVDALTVLVCSVRRDAIPGALRFRWVRDAHPDCRVVHVTDEVPQAPEDDPEFWPIWTDLIARYAGRVDTVFTSEAYGDEFARRLGATHVAVDPARRVVPASGTAIRADPLAMWEFIPPQVRPYYVRRVALVGPESAGKTTLAQRLAAELDTVWVPEYGRAYCDGSIGPVRDARTLVPVDFEAIAWGQATWEDEAATRANRVLICDTELQTTCTWSDLIVGTRAEWLTRAARARPYDLFLLLDADVPWVDDGTRVLQSARVEHVARLMAELEAANRRVVMLGGDFEERYQGALRAIRELLRLAPKPQRVCAGV